MAVEPLALVLFMMPKPGLYQDTDSVILGGMDLPAIFMVTVFLEFIIKHDHVPAEVVTAAWPTTFLSVMLTSIVIF